MIVKIRILNKPWEVRILIHSRYKKKFGEDSLGICDREKRRISLSQKFVDYETIVHELTHAYLSEICINSSDIDADALEEIFCELMSKFGSTLIRQGKRVYKELKKYEVVNADV